MDDTHTGRINMYIVYNVIIDATFNLILGTSMGYGTYLGITEKFVDLS